MPRAVHAYHLGMRCFAILIVVLCLVACGDDSATRMYDDYLWRLGNASAVAVPSMSELPAMSLPQYPRRRLRRQPVPAVEGGLLDLFRLARCDVAELIAERNSILGRHADAARVLTNSGLVLRRLQRCHQDMSTDPEDDIDPVFMSRLDGLIVDKQRAVQALAWNATLGSDALAGWWGLATDPIDVDRAEATAQRARQHMMRLQQAQQAALAGDQAKADTAFSEAYQQVERSPYGGSWLHSVRLTIQALEAASAALEVVDIQRLCPQQRPTPDARVLHTVFRQRYVDRIQPYLAQLAQAMPPLATSLDAMTDAAIIELPQSVAAFRATVWADTGDSLRGRLTTATRAHAHAWQTVLRPCGLLPGD